MASFSTYMTQPIGYVPVGVYTPPITSTLADRTPLYGVRGVILGEGYSGFNRAVYLGAAGIVATLVGVSFWIAKGKKAHTAAKVAAFGVPIAGTIIAADMYLSPKQAS